MKIEELRLPSSGRRPLRWVLVVAAVWLVAGASSSVLLAQRGRGAGPAPAAAGQAGGLETIQIRPNVWVIFGAGGNVVVQTGQEGVILIDSGGQAQAPAVLAALRRVTDQPVRYIINTSADDDHVGGNVTLAAAGFSLNPNAFASGTTSAAILAAEGVLTRMSAPTGEKSDFPVEAWPTETFTGKQKTMYVNGEGFQILHYPTAHTDGDSAVFMRRVDVVAAGDIIDLRHFPVIDPKRGGSIQGEIAALNRLLELAIPAMPLVYQEGRTLIVPGHGRVMDHADLVEYRDMVTIIRDVIEDQIKKGMTLAQVQAANPTAGYRRRYGSDTGPWTTEQFVAAIYAELKK